MKDKDKIEQLLNKAISTNNDNEALSCLRKVKKIAGNDLSNIMKTSQDNPNKKVANQHIYKNKSALWWHNYARDLYNENVSLKSKNKASKYRGKTAKQWAENYSKLLVVNLILISVLMPSLIFIFFI